METKDLNSIGLAYLEMVEKKNTEAKKNHANALHKNQKALDVHSDEDEDHNDDPTDGDGDIDAADLKKLRQDADKDDKKFDKKKKSSKKDDDQDKFKAYSGDITDGQQGAAIGEDAKYPHMMYDPKTGKGYKAETPADHEKYEKMGYTHDKPEEIDESADLQEGAARQAALAKGLMDYCKEIGKDHMDHKDFADHAKHVKAGNWDKARKHADDQDTEVREKIHTLAIDHLGQGAASELYGGDRVSLSKNKGDGKLNASYNESVNVDIDHMGGPDANAEKHNITIKKNKGTDNSHDASGNKKDLQKYLAKHYDSVEDAKELHPEVYESVNVDDVLALIDQGYTLDQAEAMVAEACGGGGGGGTGGPQGGLHASRKYPDDKKLLKASRKQSKAGDNDRNMANDQRSIPAKGADTAPVRPGTKQQQRDFDKAARMAKSKDKVSVAKAPWESVEVDEGYGSMVSPKDRARIKARVDANMDKLSAGQKKIAKQTPPRHKITGDDFKHLRKHGHGNSPQKESVMDRVSNMVEDIRVNIQEDRDQDQEDRDNRAGPGGKYISYFDSDNAAIKRQLELGPKGPHKNAQRKIEKHNPDPNHPDHNPAIADMISKRNKPNSGTNVVQMKRAAKINAAKINEVSKETLSSYAKKAMDDVDTQSRFATEYEKRGMAAKSTAVQDKNFKKANRADDKLRNRKAGINTAIDKMAKEGAGDINNPMKGMTSGNWQGSGPAEPMRVKTMSKKREKELRDAGKLSNSANNASHYAGESVQEASKPTGIHHPIDPTPGKEVNSKDAAGRAADIRASRNPLSMTEKEFVEMHQVPTTVDPAFDGNVAAKQTAENAKKAPIKQAKTPNTPTSKGDQKIMPDPTPYGGPAVKTESYMDKYAKYIRGEI